MIDVADLIGVPYKEHGRSIKDGLDCYGLVLEIVRRMGKTPYDIYYDDHKAELSDINAKTLPVHETTILREGTILEMCIDGELHMGVALNSREFIHAVKPSVRINRIGTLSIRKMWTWD